MFVLHEHLVGFHSHSVEDHDVIVVLFIVVIPVFGRVRICIHIVEDIGEELNVQRRCLMRTYRTQVVIRWACSI
jgi:hypothetical protein